MQLKYDGKNLLFETTELSDIFFTEYLSCANGDAIKVYLYMLFLSIYNKEIKINDLSKILSLSVEVVQNSIKFWEDNEILIKKGNEYILKSIQDITLNKLYKAKVTLSSEQNNEISKNKYRVQAINSINTNFFQGVMNPTWYNDIELWFDKYGFDEQVMISLFQHCYNKSAINKPYIQAVASAWQQNNIKTYSDLELYYQKQDKMFKLKKSISKKLGLSRQLTEFEDAYVQKWSIEYGYDMNVIELALKKTTSKINLSFNYINSIIEDWHNNNLNTPDEIEKYINQSKINKQKIKEFNKNINNSSNERKYDNLDFLYANIPNNLEKK